MTDPSALSVQVPASATGQRLDVVAVQMFPEYSRARLQAWIKCGALCVDNRQVKPNTKLVGNETLTLIAQEQDQGEWLAEPMDVALVHEDEHILVVNKPAGLVVHPAAGNYQGTLLNGLLHRWPSLRAIPRAGIVHRLDKDTTGLMVVAKTLEAQARLVEQLQARTVSRQYVALVIGKCPLSGVIEQPIGRDPKNRKKMAVVMGGKEAITHYKRLDSYTAFSWVELQLKTGRTHQIRVHMAHMGYPLVGDPVYGRSAARTAKGEGALAALLAGFTRQALHAKRLSLKHPQSGCTLSWEAPLPEDLDQLLSVVRSTEAKVPK